MATPVSGAISINDIDAAFGYGKNLAAYRGKTWYRPGTLVTGAFPSSGPLSMSDFYNKQGSDPAGSGSQTYTSGTNNFTVPLYRNKLVIEIWGGGGSGGPYDRNGSYGPGGSETRVYLPNGIQFYASGGGGGQGAGTDRFGGVRFGVGGAGGGAGGGNKSNLGGASGGTGDNGYGGASPNGGTTAGVTPYGAYNETGTPGKAPGGGGSGFNFYAVRGSGEFDFYASSGGGGGAGYSAYELQIGVFAGQVITVTVGAGGVSACSAGANGQAKFTWS